jgi:transposase-like protein
MNTKEHFAVNDGSRRTFSDEFKRRKVNEIESGLTKVSDICKAYHVSNVAVYKWIYKFSTTMKRKDKVIVEAKSDTVLIQKLKARIELLERTVGQDKVMIDYLQQLIDTAEEMFNIDIKKNATDLP